MKTVSPSPEANEKNSAEAPISGTFRRVFYTHGVRLRAVPLGPDRPNARNPRHTPLTLLCFRRTRIVSMSIIRTQAYAVNMYN